MWEIIKALFVYDLFKLVAPWAILFGITILGFTIMVIVGGILNLWNIFYKFIIKVLSRKKEVQLDNQD